MTRKHDPSYKALLDPYAAHRCPECEHLTYPGDTPGVCHWKAEGCTCTDHRLPDAGPKGGEGS